MWVSLGVIWEEISWNWGHFCIVEVTALELILDLIWGEDIRVKATIGGWKNLIRAKRQSKLYI